MDPMTPSEPSPQEPTSDRKLLEHLLKTVTTVAIKIDHMYERLADHRQLTYDHEQRLRLLEAQLPGKPDRLDIEARLRLLEDSVTTIKASRGTATWLWQAALGL